MDLEGYRTLEEYQINFYRKSNEPFKYSNEHQFGHAVVLHIRRCGRVMYDKSASALVVDLQLIKGTAREAKSNEAVTCQSAAFLASTLTNINSATLLSYIYDDVDV
ncbi:hypothetical protein EVAR_2701_1 [Eumeta japonica]|uniref:Uncharacterized protein n=1 Tax=Eumeta variegata TaxID=151549 RepID=A0A4C1SMB4_EUMVA|nr:hypothetical protein EVAR_2701_1 [Eumeta japonica]